MTLSPCSLPALRAVAATALTLALASPWARAQPTPLAVLPAPQNVVSLQAQASTEVPQDLLTMVLAATREGPEAAQVQSQLRQVLDAALAEARRQARPGQLEVRTGGFSLYPRYNNKPGGGNSITGWTGRAELVLEGRDTAGISQLAGRLSGLTVQQVGFSLSREARDQVEAEVAAQAIGRFKVRAERYAQAFGFASYSLREVAVGGTDVGGGPVVPTLRMARSMAGAAVADEAQPVEAGKATVSVTVSGSIQLSPR
jgi:predicted secreted protein